MAHTVRYTGTRPQMDDAALRDCKFYLGDKFDYVVQQLREYVELEPVRRSVKWRTIRFNLSFIGIEGRHPVRAIIREIGRP